MKRHELLQGLHAVLQPRTYLEIGVRDGGSLALARCPSVAVDPFFRLTREIRCDVHLVRTTSDEFFARRQPLAHLPRPVIDLAFIDGMHLSEFALRDFINVERFCHPGSVVVFDDVLPRTVVEAGRSRDPAARTGAWAGDVYKVVDTLRTLRPDLVVLEMDTEPTGTLIVLNPDPRSTVLFDAYDELVLSYVTPDPQSLPDWSLQRHRAHVPSTLLSSSMWSELRRSRPLPDRLARAAVARALRTVALVGRSGS